MDFIHFKNCNLKNKPSVYYKSTSVYYCTYTTKKRKAICLPRKDNYIFNGHS